MKWYEQSTSEYDSLVGKQLLKQYGAAGYGAYIILKQIIGQNMTDDLSEWGFVSKDETIESLAQKCGFSIDEFRQFITFCDERFIFEKRDGRLFCPSLLEEKNRYAKIQERRIKRNSEHYAHSAHTDTQDAQNKVTTQHNTSTTHKKKKYIKKENSLKGEAQELIELFNRAFEKHYTLTERRRRLVGDRLKTFSLEELQRAVTNLGASPFHRGNNDRKWVADPDFLFRSDEQVDKALNLEVSVRTKPAINLAEEVRKAQGGPNA